MIKPLKNNNSKSIAIITTMQPSRTNKRLSIIKKQLNVMMQVMKKQRSIMLT
jgi:hypothetical protein